MVRIKWVEKGQYLENAMIGETNWTTDPAKGVLFESENEAKVWLEYWEQTDARTLVFEPIELRLWSDGSEMYIAESIPHAMALQKDRLGENPVPAANWLAWTPPDPLSMFDEKANQMVTKPIAEWVELGPGFLCSTE